MLLQVNENNFFEQSEGPMAYANGKEVVFSAFLKYVQSLGTTRPEGLGLGLGLVASDLRKVRIKIN